MSETNTEKIEFPEIIPVDTELISEPIIDTSEIIGTNTEKINEFSGIIPEKISEKRRYRGQRGQDKAPRQLNYNSIMNLKPFKSKAVTIEKETPVGLSNDEIRVIGIILLMAIFGIIVWKIIEWLKESVEITEIVHIGKGSNTISIDEELDEDSFQIYEDSNELDREFGQITDKILQLKPKDVKDFDITKPTLWRV